LLLQLLPILLLMLIEVAQITKKSSTSNPALNTHGMILISSCCLLLSSRV